MSRSLEVWLDADLVPTALQVGTLLHDRGQVRFAYEDAWLRHPLRFALDPDLSLDAGSFHPSPEQGNFRVFDDSSPDRWGQTLMKRREALDAKDQGRAPRVLHAWDFLTGVQDVTRQGALRFRPSGEAGFVASHPLPAPPVASLRELEAVARELSGKHIDDLSALRRWLSVLVAPGASLGGARPKANFTEADGSLWIAKFPARDDARDIGAWEGIVHWMAANAGIDVPPCKVLRLGKDHCTFCVKRFDRTEGKRRFYASAMALLRKDRSEGTSYLELAEFIQQQGAQGSVRQDLAQLFRRVVFNVAVGHRDDHLRNHGFLLTPTGWRLAPAFDMNPIIDKAEHVLDIDEADNRPDLHTVVATAGWYRLTPAQAAAVVDEVIRVTRQWRNAAARAGIARADVELSAVAFGQTEGRAR
ncbi:MAG: HipA domain protein [Methylibium sp. NZG]|nr:MAG: HipA domain protein [Methylibium sp. NZG]